MKKNKFVIYLLIIFITFFMFNINLNVYATCKYKVNYFYQEDKNGNKIINNNNLENLSKEQPTVSVYLENGKFKTNSVIVNLKEDNIKTSMFYTDNNVLYCPNKVFVNIIDSNNVYLSDKKDTNSGLNYKTKTNKSITNALCLDSKVYDINGKMYCNTWAYYGSIATIYENEIDENERIYEPTKVSDVELSNKQVEKEKILEEEKQKKEDTKIETDNNNEKKEIKKFEINYNKDTIYDCEGLLDENLIEVAKMVLKCIQIIAPIILIIMITLDFSKVVVSNNKDAMTKAISKSIKRAIAALVIFFIPYIVSVVLDLPGIKGSTDPNCGIVDINEK